MFNYVEMERLSELKEAAVHAAFQRQEHQRKHVAFLCWLVDTGKMTQEDEVVRVPRIRPVWKP